MRRKRIALITINLDGEGTQEVINGVVSQCNQYGYDVAVFSPMVHISHYFKNYLEGELKIYDLINFDKFDGVIISPIQMQENRIMSLTKMLLEKFKQECKVPVVSVNEIFGDYEMVKCDETVGVRMMTKHLVETHRCKDIMVMTGPADFRISRSRLEGVRDELKHYGLELSEDRIVYGDFWYTSGEDLGERIINGEISKPEAILCTSDHMAIGLVKMLQAGGISVPEEIIVTGTGGTKDSALSFPTITTVGANDAYTAAMAVNRLRELMEPGEKLISTITDSIPEICKGATCGCREDAEKIHKKLRDYVYTSEYDTRLAKDDHGISLTTLLDSYVLETFTASQGVRDTLNKIYESLHLLVPYRNFYLCLNDGWLNTNISQKTYTDRMNMVIFSDMEKKLHGHANHVFFGKGHEKTYDVKELLPDFDKQEDKPQIYYFTPIHIEDSVLGYAVLQNDLEANIRVTSVYKNYLRYINNALELARAKNFMLSVSEHDQLTGLYNRHGLTRVIAEWKDIYGQNADADGKPIYDPELRYLIVVVDMNNLKILNDTEGHEAGDIGICTVGRAVEKTLSGDEIAVRAGGDEFYLIGVGKYNDADGEQRVATIKANLEAECRKAGRNPQYTASAGFAIGSLEKNEDYREILELADVAMYKDKRKGKLR